MNECKHCTLEASLCNLSKVINGATWEYPAYLSIPSPTNGYANFGIEFDGENRYELIGNDEEGASGGAITLTGDETETELKAKVFELFHLLYETEGN